MFTLKSYPRAFDRLLMVDFPAKLPTWRECVSRVVKTSTLFSTTRCVARPHAIDVWVNPFPSLAATQVVFRWISLELTELGYREVKRYFIRIVS